MRQYYVAVFTISFLLFLGAISVAADLEDGFMEYNWGENVSQYEGLTKLYTKGDVSYYSNPGESYILDDISINDVIFGFYKENLFAVYIGIDSPGIYNRIRQHMSVKYGLPDHKTVGKEQLTLKWKYKNVSIKLKTDELKSKMKLSFYSNLVSRDLKKKQLEEIDNRSFRFVPIEKDKKPEKFQFLQF